MNQRLPAMNAASNADAGWRLGWRLLVLAAPIVASMVSRTVMSFVDFAMVSQLGTAAQAAILPAGILLFCVLGFGMGVLSIVNTFVAQALGRGRPADGAAYAWQSVWLSLAMAVLALPTWFLVPELFRAIDHAPAVQAMEITYVQIGILGFFPSMVALGLPNFFTGIHQPAVGFWSALIANVFNAGANYVLIFGHLGFPALGIGGAAIATQLAATLQALILMAWFLRPRMAREFNTRRAWRPDVGRAWNMLRFGLPAGFQTVTDVGAYAIFTLLLIGRFGTVQLAAHNLAFKYLEIAFMPTLGLGIALTAAVGKAIGEDDRPLARRIARWGAGIGLTYTGLVALSYLLFRYPMARLFTDDPEVVRWAAAMLICCAVFEIFDALNILYVSALRGAGDTLWPALTAGCYVVFVFLLGGWMVAEYFSQWGSLGPWWVSAVYIALLGLTMWARWRYGPWERIEIGEVPATSPAAAAGTA